MLKCIAVDDEPLALKRLQEFIRKVPFLDLQAGFDNSLQALAYLTTHQPPVVFLDIQMDELTGIQLLESLNYRPQVILTTAFEIYALKGFELQVTDYLLKPYSFSRFLQAVNRLEQTQDTVISGYLFIKTGSRLEKIDLSEIRYIEGMRDQRCIYLADKKVMTPETFGDLEKQLPVNHFCRVHKSFIVGLQHVRSVERDRIIIGQELIPVSETYKQQFYERIKKPR